MNRFEIRDILKAHREHFRVLPTLAQNELNRIIAAVDAGEQDICDLTDVTKKVAVSQPAPTKKKPVKKVAKKKKAR